MKRKAIFLDKDGTLITDVPYNVDPRLLQFEPGVPDGLARLRAEGYALVVISNQPGIAMGLFSKSQLEQLIDFFYQKLQNEGIALAGFYYCPHQPAPSSNALPGCACRKPAPGLILQAAAELDIDLAASWMVGDILNDVQAGNTAGCRTILINNGNETEWMPGPDREPDFMARNFADATQFILAQTVTAHA